MKNLLIKGLSELFEIEITPRIKKDSLKNNRDYQFDYIDFDIQQTDTVVDIGSGAFPFKYATHLVDLYTDDNSHRGGNSLVQDERPLFVADLEKLPFSDKQFDFAYCSHVLEHVSTPSLACNEIMRIAKRGYIETPTRISDVMFNYTYIHSWHIAMVGNSLIFMPYSQREANGTGMNAFELQKQSPYQNDFSQLVSNNRDLFCNMMLWKDRFDYYVFDQEGSLVDSSK